MLSGSLLFYYSIQWSCGGPSEWRVYWRFIIFLYLKVGCAVKVGLLSVQQVRGEVECICGGVVRV